MILLTALFLSVPSHAGDTYTTTVVSDDSYVDWLLDLDLDLAISGGVIGADMGMVNMLRPTPPTPATKGGLVVVGQVWHEPSRMTWFFTTEAGEDPSRSFALQRSTKGKQSNNNVEAYMDAADPGWEGKPMVDLEIWTYQNPKAGVLAWLEPKNGKRFAFEITMDDEVIGYMMREDVGGKRVEFWTLDQGVYLDGLLESGQRIWFRSTKACGATVAEFHQACGLEQSFKTKPGVTEVGADFL